MYDERDAQDYRPVAELAETFAEMVDAFTGGDTVALTAERVVELASRCLPAAQHTGIVVEENGEAHTIAATSGTIERLDRIRDEIGEGPALDVLEVNDMVISEMLADDDRWPAFGERVLNELNIRSMLAYRLYLSAERRAALIFCSDWPHAFDDLAIAIGAIFASYSSLVLLTEHLFHGAVPGRRAGQVHTEIGVAVGILLTQGDLTVHEAYGRLHGAARRLRTTLPEVAQHVLTHRDLPGGA
jgi:hypothetical protein